MVFLAREFTRAKWTSKEGLSANEIPADAVTANLRTASNALSFWSVGINSEDGIEDEIKDVALVMAAGRKRLDKVELVWISYEGVQNQGVSIQQSEGKTNVVDMVDRHYDLHQLDYFRLGKIAQLVSSALETDKYIRFSKGRVKKLLAAAVEQGRMELTDLEEKVQDELCESIDTHADT